jgi:hypothetical protein
MQRTEFKVLSKPWFGAQAYDVADWEWAATVKASDHQEAAERWAEQDDQGGDYSIIGSGEHGPIKVLGPDGTVKEFQVFAESCPVYRARELSGRECKDENRG